MTSPSGNPDFPPAGEAPDDRTTWLVRHEAYLKMLARLEIDSRFQGKFSASDAVQQTLFEAGAAGRISVAARMPSEWRGCGDPRAPIGPSGTSFCGSQKRDVSRELSLDASLAKSPSGWTNCWRSAARRPAAAVAAEQRRRLAEVLERLPGGSPTSDSAPQPPGLVVRRDRPPDGPRGGCRPDALGPRVGPAPRRNSRRFRVAAVTGLLGGPLRVPDVPPVPDTHSVPAMHLS